MALALALTVGALAAAGAVAQAGEAARVPRGAIPGVRLTGAEKRAVTIASLSAVDTPSGLIVTVAFNGNLERYLGQGALRKALLALVLVPRAAGAPTAGVLDEGGGFTAEQVRVLVRHGDRAVIALRTVDAYAPSACLGCTQRDRRALSAPATK